jgi:hypothetical protein
MRFFRKGEDEFEGRLRDARPQPPAELVSEIARRLQLAPARRSPRLRLGLAAGLTSALLVAFASVGGVGYAAAAASKAATAVSHAAGSVSNTEADSRTPNSHSNAAATPSETAADPNSHSNSDSNSTVQQQQDSHDPPDPHDPGHDQYGHHRVTICHRGHTLVLPPRAAAAHLRRHKHDYPGPCRH